MQINNNVTMAHSTVRNSLRMKNRFLRVDLKETELMLLGWGMISEVFLAMI